MSTEVNYDYYSENDDLNTHIDNVLMLKKYVDTLLKEIKSGEYNVGQIQKLSSLTETFFIEFEDLKYSSSNQTQSYTFNPRASIVELNSDTESEDDSDVESNDSDYGAKREEKLKLYKSKMGRCFNSSPNPLGHYDIYNDEPEFLDENESKVKSNYLIKQQSTVTPFNTPSEPSYLDSYKQSSYRQCETINTTRSEPHIGFNYSHSNYGTNFGEKKQFTVPDEQFDRLEDLYKSSAQTVSLSTPKISDSPQEIGVRVSSDFPKSKPKDKLADEFLNNNLELNNYHYLKSFNVTRVNNFVSLCYSY
jgi:hypothetical protein